MRLLSLSALPANDIAIRMLLKNEKQGERHWAFWKMLNAGCACVLFWRGFTYSRSLILCTDFISELRVALAEIQGECVKRES